MAWMDVLKTLIFSLPASVQAGGGREHHDLDFVDHDVHVPSVPTGVTKLSLG